jgi:hypothetical protein
MRWRTASPYGEAARRRILSLSVRVLGLPGQEPNLNLVSASNIDVAKTNKLIIANVVAAIATCARGHEIEFFIRQFDRVSESGHVLHVGLLSVCDISGGIFAVTAATLSLAARHQSGCTAAKIFLCGTARRLFFNLVFIFVFHSFYCFVFHFILMPVFRKATVELIAVNIFIGYALG